ncbi:TFIIB-type zinc ribbon-containing protein [Phytoactinopolyspora halotolerans]|uniref:Transcriptional regulator n=1 Tax=Phytoactinopolyspora halotolerans TaxID=1981512 RepID=A0A6L9S223_9ACTN|nr:zf-TFIIB domain-containing protein [Phytoactinopolyspora halotolerans]NED99058.1 transcriptional regulator [Phytoactinopolyspora halotolerans]
MTCPKCDGTMRTFDRLGVHVEQCQNCRGIFLDYGELEQIVDAEQRHNGSPPPLEYGAPPVATGPVPDRRGYRPDSPAPYRGRPDSPAPYRGGPDSPAPYRGRPDSPGPFGGGFGRYKDSPRPYGGRRRKSFFEQLFD